MPPSAHNRFEHWLQSRPETITALSVLLGCDRNRVHQLRRGGFPGRRLANAIERESTTWEHGPIRSVEWDDAEDRQRASA